MSTTTGLSSCCVSGTIHEGTPTGREEIISGVRTYVAEPESKSKAQVVVYLVDIFGIDFVNTRLLADSYAKEGFYVYIPDILNGDPLPISFLRNVEPPLKEQEQAGLIEKAKNTAIVGSTLLPWLAKHPESMARPIINKFIDALRSEPGVGKIGTIGFCYGGRYSILAAIDKVDAAVACHPSVLSIPADFENINKPLSLAVGAKDSHLDMKTVNRIREVLDSRKDVPTEVVVYEDQIHGFAVRSDWSSEKDRKAMDDAQKQATAWFKKYLA